MKSVITLISDWRLRDPYLAIFKGQILSVMPDVQILDITHHIDYFNIAQTAFVLKQSYSHFPQGSIHLILTNISNTSLEKPVVLFHNGHYFIGNDSGIFSLMFGKECALMGRQAMEDQDDTLTMMIHLANQVRKGNIEDVTVEYNQFRKIICAEAIHVTSERSIEGEIIYIDAACNALTNISTQMFKSVVQDNPFIAIVQSRTEWKIKKYCDTYAKIDSIYLTTNKLGCIEITMFQSNIAILASMNVGDKVIIKY